MADPHRCARSRHDCWRPARTPLLRRCQTALAAFAGREFDADLLRDFPPGIDPCGERGEFHTCVYAGPMFSAPLPLESGEIVTRDGFTFADFSILSATPLAP